MALNFILPGQATCLHLHVASWEVGTPSSSRTPACWLLWLPTSSGGRRVGDPSWTQQRVTLALLAAVLCVVLSGTRGGSWEQVAALQLAQGSSSDRAYPARELPSLGLDFPPGPRRELEQRVWEDIPTSLEENKRHVL